LFLSSTISVAVAFHSCKEGRTRAACYQQL
jgi:hypothetical protein